MSETIKTALGEFDKDKFRLLLDVRNQALYGFRRYHDSKLLEVTPSSLVNIAGSCENPHASFTVNYYGKEAHLSQSAQLQLEALVLRGLYHSVYTINNSFREEHYDDPEQAGRRLSEFTLIEAETSKIAPREKQQLPQRYDAALSKLISHATGALYTALGEVLLNVLPKEEEPWGLRFYKTLHDLNFMHSITYDAALDLLNSQGGAYKFGDDLGIREERTILRHFDNQPVAITHHPASLKFFNLKRTLDGQRTYSFDILLPPLGESVGGGLREENGEAMKKQLLESRVAQYLQDKKRDPLQEFGEYLALFEQEPELLRGGYGIGFERFIGFLLNSNDILNTIAYRTLRPEGGRA